MRPRINRLRRGGYEIEVLGELGTDRDRCERELLDAGLPLPLPHRTAWAWSRRPAPSWFLAARDTTRRCRGGFALEVSRSRALPGQLLLRVERLGASLPEETEDALLGALADLAARDGRVLRVNVEVFSADATRRVAIGRSLCAFGFHQAAERRTYSETVAVDLTPTEQTIFASLPPRTRRGIRAVEKNPVTLKAISDPAVALRMDRLCRETMARTGGAYHPQRWDRRIELSVQVPTLSRLVGLFRADQEGPEALLAFAWGCGHGDHAHYEAAASTRRTDLRMPLSYALAWDLICWARDHGARWFDFGGVTPGHTGSDDSTGGISDFKRFFSTTVVRVGDEWVLEPSRMRASVARAVSASVSWLRRARQAWSKSR